MPSQPFTLMPGQPVQLSSHAQPEDVCAWAADGHLIGDDVCFNGKDICTACCAWSGGCCAEPKPFALPEEYVPKSVLITDTDPVCVPVLNFRKWWLRAVQPSSNDGFLSEDVVYTMCAWASVNGHAIDATAVLLQEDPETGIEVPTDVHYRGLAVLFLEFVTGTIVCANPVSSDIAHLPVHWLSYLRVDPWTDQPLQTPS